MDSKIVTGGKMEKAVFLEIENEELQFMGFIKANVSMNEETRKIANTILSKLYETWTGKYHKLSWIQYKTEFRYESLKDIQPILNNAREEGILDSEKIYMSLIAVCNFPKKRKLFWISTGNFSKSSIVEPKGKLQIAFLKILKFDVSKISKFLNV